MITAKGNGLNDDGNILASAKKEWHQPGLRKLPISATSGTHGKFNPAGDDGVAVTPGDAAAS
jgi:hypothetical protein